MRGNYDPRDSRFYDPCRNSLCLIGAGSVVVIYAITDRNPLYLKAIYPAPVTIVNVIDELPAGAVFIQWGGNFQTLKLTRSRRAIPLGRFTNVHEAIFNCRRAV